MTDILSQLPPGLCHMDEGDQELAKLATKAERQAYHAKRLPQIHFAEGMAGVRRYIAKFPEAAAVHLKIGHSFAVPPKPSGYDDDLCSIVRRWFVSDVALAETNRATVQRLNERLQSSGHRLDPDRHFSTDLSARRLDKLADIFAEHGTHLDTSRVNTMSDVKAAVKVAKGFATPGRPFAKVGRIVDDQLVCGNQSFRIEQHSGHPCIRIMAKGSRVRLRLDGLEEFVRHAGLSSGETPRLVTSVAIPELAPNGEMGDFDPLIGTAGAQSFGELAPNIGPPIYSPADVVPIVDRSLGELTPSDPLALTDEEIAAVRASVPAHSTACISDPDENPDPLTL